MNIFGKKNLNIDECIMKYKNQIWVFSIIIMIMIIAFFIARHYNMTRAFDAEKHVASHESVQHIRPLLEDERYRWKSSSKYTLVIYFSYDCQFCRKLEKYISDNKIFLEGKFNLVYRNAPIVQLEPLSPEKALIGECVYRIGGIDALFTFSDVFNSKYKIFHTDNDWVKDIANDTLDNNPKFGDCLKSNESIKKIEKDIAYLLVERVTSVPTIGIFYDTKLVGRYSAGYHGTLNVMNYLATFDQNADQFWSDALYKKINNSRANSSILNSYTGIK